MKWTLGLVCLFLISFVKTLEFDDASCIKQLNYFDDELSKRENWAIKFFDTWAKIQSGVLTGNHQNPGFFTECVNFLHTPETSSVDTIKGQHCMVSFTAKENVSFTRGDEVFDWREIVNFAREKNLVFTHGLCLPASCSMNNVLTYSDGILESADLKAVSAICRTNDSISFRAIDVIATVIFSSFGFLLLSSTIYDLLMIRRNEDPNKLFVAFSMYTNGAALFDITKSKNPNAINCLNGIRALSVFWIIFGHRFDERFMVPSINSDAVFGFPEKPISLIHSTFTLAVDTFFLMGGLLVTSSILSALDKKTLNIPRMYLHRYLRYTPVLMMLILFFVTFPKYLGSGPFYNLDSYVPQCEKYWWSALLHVQNYVNPNQLCLDWSWYLSADFHLFILSPLMIYPLWRWKKCFWILVGIVHLSMGCIFTSSYRNDILVFVGRMIPRGGRKDWERLIYFPTHTRCGPWIIGILLGYIMYQTRSKRFEICRIWNAIFWILSLSTLLTIVLCYYPFQRLEENNTTTIFGNALYNALFRVGWSCAVSWIIFACHNGSGGIIRWFLSLRQWQPIGRMGLSVYLVHRIYQIITIHSQKQPLHFEFFSQLHKFWGDIIVALTLGAILYLTFEVPFLLIENYFYKKIQSRK